MAKLPLFPLSTVLFPGGLLPLRLFEPRYIDMVGRCMREDTSFGVVLIREGSETAARSIFEVGCVARIIDWYQNEDGLLGITARGERRFRVLQTEREGGGLQVAKVDWLEPETDVALQGSHPEAVATLRAAIAGAGDWYAQIEHHFDSAAWVGARLTEMLPLANEQKQACLEMDDSLARLELLRPVIAAVTIGN